MTNVDETQVTSVSTPDAGGNDGADYIEAIKQLKANSVDKSRYDKVVAENKKLLKSLVNGESIETAAPEETVGVEDLRKDLFSPDSDMNNLDYITKALQLREKLIECGDRDPFLPWGHNITPTDQDIEAAERTARIMQECVDYADGDSEVFTNELMRRTIDTAPIQTKRR